MFGELCAICICVYRLGDLPVDGDLFSIKRAHDAPDITRADDLSRKVCLLVLR